MSDFFRASGAFPQAISLTHDHAPCALIPWEGGKTFVDQASRPFLGRGVCRIACVWRLPAGTGDLLVYIRSTPWENTHTGPYFDWLVLSPAQTREKIDRRHRPALCSDHPMAGCPAVCIERRPRGIS